jgi:SAM-dependent methyltransferase
MNGKLDLISVAKLYEDSLSEHGVSSKAVGWPDDAMHRVRFEKLASVIDRSVGPVSVNDLGCGYGAFSVFLRDSGIEVGEFCGYDISERMIAQACVSDPAGKYIVGSRLDRTADYSFACGIFNVRLQEEEHTWRTYVESVLDNLDAHSTRGFAFNLLSTYVDYRMPHLFYGDPLYFFHLCKTRYGKRVALLHDYPLYEWTIAVTKA